MADILELLGQIGALDAPKKNSVSTAGAIARYRQQNHAFMPPAVSSGNGEIDWSQSTAKQPAKGDSSFASDIWGFVKDAINVVDTPRAYLVSGVKELSDALYSTGWSKAVGLESDEEYRKNRERLGDASWDDFTEQADRHMGFREVWDEAHDSVGDKSWLNRVVGFAGDVALDPLTYSGTGLFAKGLNKGGSAAEKALQQAARHGGRNAIAKQLEKQSAAMGVRQNAAVINLIADAGQRGTGALTRGALKKAGLSAAEIEALGIGRLSKTVFGAAIPGTTRIAETSAATKGYFKKVFGEQGWTKAARRAKIADAQGERLFIDTMRRKGVSSAMRADAATALLSVNSIRSKAHGWFDDTVRQVHDDFGKELHQLGDEGNVLATHALESGATDPLSLKTRGLFDQTHVDVNKMGADTPYTSNYVPHIVTDDFYKLAEDRPELMQWITSPSTKQGFQKTRTLKAGDEFLGETLAEGTIKEINEISMAKLGGVKIFEDNMSHIIPMYLTKARSAILSQGQLKALKDFGAATLATKGKKSLRAFTDVEKATLKATKEAHALASAAQSVALSDGRFIRMSQSKVAKAALRVQQKENAKAILAAEHKVADLGRSRADAMAVVARTETELNAAQASLDAWVKVVGTQKGAVRRQNQATIKALEKKIAALTAKHDDAAAALQKIIDGGGKGRSKAALGFKAEVDAAGAERTALVAKQAQLADDLVRLNNVPPEFADPAMNKAAEAVSQETAKVASLRVASTTAKNTAHVADMTYSFALADHTVVSDLLTKTEGELEEAMTKLIGMPPGGARLEARKLAAVEIRDRVAFVRKLLERQGDPAWDIMAKQETQAIILDMKAWRAGRDVFDAQKVLNTMNDPAFREYIVMQADHGMTMIDDTHMMPSWINDALTVEHRMKSPQLWSEFSKQANKFNNIWKGWATARPGFMTRNAYGGMFNIWLEGGPKALKSTLQFISFWKVYKADPEHYLENALKRWDQATVDQMDAGLHTVFATGGGLVPAEVEAGLGRAKTLKPWSTDNVFIRGTRAGSENIEAVLRGGHAYDVLKRGGTADLANDIVTKWHFNYRDITDLDRTIKTVGMPFWTFYSRNLALQAHVWSHMPQKLNRSYFNAKRNLEYGNDEDVNRPGWLDEGGAVQLGDGGEGKDTPYWMPDLPSLKAITDVDKLMHPFDGRLVSDMNPLVKLPFEHVAGRKTFSGIPFKDVLSERVDGETVGREAPSWAQIPGIEQLLGALGVVDHNASGQTVMGDEQQYMGEAAFPLLGDITRLLPNQPKQEAKESENWLSFLGLGLKYNTDDSRQGEQYRRKLAAEAAAKRARELGL